MLRRPGTAPGRAESVNNSLRSQDAKQGVEKIGQCTKKDALKIGQEK